MRLSLDYASGSNITSNATLLSTASLVRATGLLGHGSNCSGLHGTHGLECSNAGVLRAMYTCA